MTVHLDYGSVAIANRTDPEVVASSNDQLGILAELRSQIKLQLLLCEHIALPDGFLFDNPALWILLKSDSGLTELLKSRWGDGYQCGVLITETISQGIDDRFRRWFQRPELRPSSLRIPWAGNMRGRPSSQPLHSFKNDWATLGGYAEAFGLTHLDDRLIDSLESLMSSMHHEQKDLGWQSHYLKNIRSLFGQRDLYFRKCSVRDGIGEQYRQFSNWLFNPSTKSASRGQIQTSYPAIWKSYSGLFNSARQSTFVPQKPISTNAEWTRYAPLPVNIGNHIDLKTLMQPYNSEFGNDPDAAVSIDNIGFGELVQIRSHDDFRSAIRETAELIKSPAFTLEDYRKQIATRWGPALVQAVSKLQNGHRYLRVKNKAGILSSAWAPAAINATAVPSGLGAGLLLSMVVDTPAAIASAQTISLLLTYGLYRLAGPLGWIDTQEPSMVHLLIQQVNDSLSPFKSTSDLSLPTRGPHE